MNLDLLLDTPWWLPAGLAVVGVVVWVSGNRRRDKALMNIGLVALLAAVAVTAVSYFVDTPTERAEKSTHAFVNAVVKQDLDTARGILHPNAYVKVMGAATPYANRDEIVRAIERADDTVGLKSANTYGMAAVRADDVITITFNVLSDHEGQFARQVATKWEFQYQRMAEGWGLSGITLLSMPGLSAQEAERQFPSVR